MLWRTRFERINFGFNPVLYQMADVVFECKVTEAEYKLARKSRKPEDFAPIHKLSSACWKAMSKQNPQWDDYDGPVKGSDGWSSILGGYAGSKYFPVKKAKECMANKQFPRRRWTDANFKHRRSSD